MAGFWDDPDVTPSASKWMKFENVGDEVEGIVKKLSKRKFEDGKTAIQIEWTDDEVPIVTASQTLLKKTLFELKPEPGDTLGIKWVAEEGPVGRRYKKFEVGIRRADGTTQFITA